jgi:hypothetical protein
MTWRFLGRDRRKGKAGFFGVKRGFPRGIEHPRGSAMPQFLLQGFPDGGAQRVAPATLIANGHVRPREVEHSALGMPRRTLTNRTGQWAARGRARFSSPAVAARLADVGELTLRKAVKTGRVVRATMRGGKAESGGAEATSKSARGQADARAAKKMDTACTSWRCRGSWPWRGFAAPKGCGTLRPANWARRSHWIGCRGCARRARSCNANCRTVTREDRQCARQTA